MVSQMLGWKDELVLVLDSFMLRYMDGGRMDGWKDGYCKLGIQFLW